MIKSGGLVNNRLNRIITFLKKDNWIGKEGERTLETLLKAKRTLELQFPRSD